MTPLTPPKPPMPSKMHFPLWAPPPAPAPAPPPPAPPSPYVGPRVASRYPEAPSNQFDGGLTSVLTVWFRDGMSLRLHSGGGHTLLVVFETPTGVDTLAGFKDVSVYQVRTIDSPWHLTPDSMLERVHETGTAPLITIPRDDVADVIIHEHSYHYRFGPDR